MYSVLHCWEELGKVAKLHTMRLRQRPPFYQLVAQLLSLGAELVRREVALEAGETSTPQEIGKIIKQGVVQECIFLANSKMLSYIQNIKKKKEK